MGTTINPLVPPFTEHTVDRDRLSLHVQSYLHTLCAFPAQGWCPGVGGRGEKIKYLD